jgi:hypothetical protein
LVTGTPAAAPGSVLYGPLAHIAQLAQRPAQLLVLPPQLGEGLSFFVHKR